MKRILAGVLLAFVAGLAGILAYAPYMPQMILEGAPDLIWSGRSTFAEVGGAPDADRLRIAVRPGSYGAELLELFEDSDGVALLAARDGRLEIEHYADGVTAETRLNSYSMVKSLVAALVFKAIADGRISGREARLGEFLPEAPGLSQVTLDRLLTMRAGIQFEIGRDSFGVAAGIKDTDTLPNPLGPLARLHYQGLMPQLAGLSVSDGGPEVWTYQNINTALLGAVLERIYGAPLETILAKEIWQPAGATSAFWRRPASTEMVSAYCCLYATARDWIRIGTFIAANGTPADPFLPDADWRTLLGLDIDPTLRAKGHYGFGMFQDVLDRPGETLNGGLTYFGGQSGQILSIMPERGLVIYRAGRRHQRLHSTHYAVWNRLSAR
ncbi:CubicO group peptidase, beta-lactamase class C family [Devosia enhydra]|uniref:CubicO group peptidase, beta-lactamase class C family n=1 Tax=Devosia enhydra TaxID=665118 RepID=A0A1K2I0D8_9HYPH|nr:serine hydrolase [Devosia enhydra]SFZ85838.1 CubicO group peptidase, beta-lactamase class C family [Devosia enhydra]